MSSEGSVSTSTSSRIRQFGLYRTIDARTEEFLRLSRKRQLRQGCACAAISTAITVTVVVTFFLVYMEYGMNSDAKQQSLGKAGWIGLFNDSFEEKFSKSKINFDRNTIKMLPILIKALKQNRYLEKILEDYSSSSPTYDGKVTTEFSFKKDVFLNTKTWMKKPLSRLYTIEYKTSPVVFVKNPTKEPGYFTKNRKIRDYKRIMEYVEKMINDKVSFGSAVPITNKEPEVQTENTLKQPQITPKPVTEITIMNKHKTLKKKSRSQTNLSNIQKPKHDEIVGCKCPKQIGILLDKIITSIQQLIPDDKISKSGLCSEDQNTNSLEPNSDKAFYPPKTKLTTTRIPYAYNAKFTTESKKNLGLIHYSEFDNIYHKEDTTNLPEETFTQPMRSKYLNGDNHFQANRLKNTNVYSNEATTVNPPAPSLSLPFLNSKNAMQTNKLRSLSLLWDKSLTNQDINAKITTVYDQIEPTESYYDTTITTQPMPPTVNRSENNTITVTEKNLLLYSEEINTAESEKIQSKYINVDSDKASQSQNLNSGSLNPERLMRIENINNDSATTTDNVFDEINKFDIQSLELLKSNLISSSKRLSSSKDPYNSSVQHEYSTTESSNKDTNAILPLKKSITPTKARFNSDVAIAITNEKNTEIIDITAKSNVTNTLESPFPIISNKSTEKYKENSTPDHDKNKQEPFYLGLENTALEDEIEKISRDDEYQEELNIKQTEKRLQSFLSNKNSTSNIQETTGTDFLQILKNNERYFGSNSMLPHNRPTYLEIHRNDWKHDENKDYDTEMKYNIFDLL